MRKLFLSGPSTAALVTAVAFTAANCGANASMVRERFGEKFGEKSMSVQNAPLHEPHVLGFWDNGICAYSGGYVTYSGIGKDKKGELKLDVDVFTPQEILCSDKFTAVFDQKFVIISLGSEKILEGIPSLGMVSGSFVAANSYKLKLKPILEDGGINQSSIDGNTLVIISNNGRTWQLDLSNPHSGWDVY